MSKIVDIDDYRAKNKPNAISAVALVTDEDNYPEFVKEILAPFKGLKDLNSTLGDILKFFDQENGTMGKVSWDNASSITMTGGRTSKEQTLKLNYDIQGSKITIYFRIYTYGLSAQENSELFTQLNRAQK